MMKEMGTRERLGLLLAVVAVAVMAVLLLLAGPGAIPALATDPEPQSVVALKTVVLEDGTAIYAADHDTDWTLSRYYGVADVFVTMEMTATDKITATIEHSPDGATWYSGTAFTAVTTSTTEYALVQTALYGEYLRLGFELSGTVGYTPTVKVTLKNN